MQVKTKLKPDYLRACLVVAAKQDIRFYLNGVFVEMTATDTRYIATDGHKMLILRDERERQEPQAPGTLIIPREAVELLPKQRTKEPTIGIDLYYDDTQTGSVEGRLGNVYFKPIEGRYPDYKKVIPKAISGERGHYKPEYLMAFQKAADLAVGRNYALPELWQNGAGAGVVLIASHPEFVGIIMPFRETSEGRIPAWLAPKEEPAPAPTTAPANAESAAVAA